MDLYSASVLEHATVGCFLDIQERQFYPRNVQNPVVLLCMSGHPAQLLSELAVRSNENSLYICCPHVVVDFGYLRISFTSEK